MSYEYQPPVPPYGTPERGDLPCPKPLTVYVPDWFSCCDHCGCTDDRRGHDDTCSHGCNDDEPGAS